MTGNDQDRDSKGQRDVGQISRDDSKLDLNAQGRQGSGSTDRDQASNVGSGYNEDAPTSAGRHDRTRRPAP